MELGIADRSLSNSERQDYMSPFLKAMKKKICQKMMKH